MDPPLCAPVPPPPFLKVGCTGEIGIGEIVGFSSVPFLRSNFGVAFGKFVSTGKHHGFFTGEKHIQQTSLKTNEFVPQKVTISVGNTSTPSIDFQGTC